MGGPGAAYAGAVAARSTIAPAFCSGFGRIKKNPSTAGVCAGPDSLHAPVFNHFAKRSANPGDHPAPVIFHWNQLCAKPILVLDEPLVRRYIQSAVQQGELSLAEGASSGEFFGSTPQKGAQALQFPARNVLSGAGMQVPMFQESSQPQGIRKVVGPFSKTVPFLAVGEVHPGSRFSKVLGMEDVACAGHGNDINQLDSLHRIG